MDVVSAEDAVRSLVNETLVLGLWINNQKRDVEGGKKRRSLRTGL